MGSKKKAVGQVGLDSTAEHTKRSGRIIGWPTGWRNCGACGDRFPTLRPWHSHCIACLEVAPVRIATPAEAAR